MASRRPPGPLPIEIRRFSPERAEGAIGLLEARAAEVKALDPKAIPFNDERVRVASQKIRSTLLEIFGETSLEFQQHRAHDIATGHSSAIAVGWRDSNFEARRQLEFAAGIPRTITMLEGLIGTVRERTDAARPAPSKKVEEGAGVASDEVFIVHGRQEGPREAVARLIGKLKLKPIILHEQASEGRTLIEKFEEHSEVGYAVVLLTGDDRGGLVDDDPSTYEPRARQNVILELGYFLGKLGRRRVCVLYEEGVEIPSDYKGVVYLPLDKAGAWQVLLAKWQVLLAKEMKAAGFDIDLNRAM